MIHMPSISSVTIGTNCLGRPLVTISYHATKEVVFTYYRTWEECQKDFARIKAALSEVEALLEKIPLTEPESKPIQEEVQKIQSIELASPEKAE